MNPELAQTIRKLKRTQSPNGSPMGYREIGMKLGISAMWAKRLAGNAKGCCPSCLRKLEKEKGSGDPGY